VGGASRKLKRNTKKCSSAPKEPRLLSTQVAASKTTTGTHKAEKKGLQKKKGEDTANKKGWGGKKNRSRIRYDPCKRNKKRGVKNDERLLAKPQHYWGG